MWSSNHFPTSSCFPRVSRSRFFRVQDFQGPGFSGFRFFRVQIFQGPGFSWSRSFRVQVFQGLAFSGSRFFRFQAFLGPGFSVSGSRVQVQGPSPGFRSIHFLQLLCTYILFHLSDNKEASKFFSGLCWVIVKKSSSAYMKKPNKLNEMIHLIF